MPTYKVNIALNDTTLTALQNGGFQMQVYKGSMSNAKGQPVVWFTLNEFSSTVSVTWADSYGGYFSNTLVENKATIVISTSSGMQPGQIFTLNSNGSGSLTSGGPAEDYTFESLIQSERTCGLTTSASGSQPAAICAFPQYATLDNMVQPYEKVLILFTQTPLNTGSVVQTAVTQSISIVMAPSEPSFTTSFDINTGWNIDGSSQAVVNAPNFTLAPDLIIPAASSTSQGNINVKKSKLKADA
jgi:hypothetical protein